MNITTRTELPAILREIINETPIIDLHTHLYASNFGSLLLWGIDDLLTYHYLVAEYFRYSEMPYRKFFSLSKEKQADLIWDTLFLKHSPISEATSGIVTILNRLGLDLQKKDLGEYRDFYANSQPTEYFEKVFKLSNIKSVVMTNDPFDLEERSIWEKDMFSFDEKFKASLRLDVLLTDAVKSTSMLQEWGYDVSTTGDQRTYSEIRRFLEYWLDKTSALYVGASFSPDFSLPTNSWLGNILEQCVLPICAERKIPLALMIGVKRRVNPEFALAGDSLGHSNLAVVEYLCSNYPNNKFMVTTLDRESQHILAVTARKFPNLMPFGSWWFLNNPSLIQEMAFMRTELLGWSYIPQHSDARVLDQLIYKWEHSRAVLLKVLLAKYNDLFDRNWPLQRTALENDVRLLFQDNFLDFLAK